MTNFPASKDDTTSLPDPNATDSTVGKHAELHTNENAAIRAIEAKLGTSASTPGGSSQILYSSGAGISTWGNLPVGGDLAGSLPNPTVPALAGKASISGQVFTGAISATNLSGTNTGDQVIPTALPPNGSAGGDLTGTYPNPTLTTTAVTPGSYTNTNLTVDAKGRITAASNGTGGGGGGTWGSITGTLSSQTDLQTALNAKQGTLTLTTTGSGAATLVGSTLNIPNTTYTLPTASTSVLGGVKVDGSTITANGSGVISAVGGVATSINGLITAGTNVTITGSGTSASPYNIASSGGGGSGTVTSVSVASANGFAGTVATATTTPAITLSTSITGLLKGNGTAISAATAGTDYQAPISLTTTGTSGAATFVGNTLNIPQYSGGSGNVTGPATSTTNSVPIYSNTTGQLLKDGLMTMTSSAGIVTLQPVTGGLTVSSFGSTLLTLNGSTGVNLNPGTGSLDLNSHRIVGVTDPASAQDAATKNYVDNGTKTMKNTTLDNTDAATLKATSFTLQDPTDTTKQAVFDLSGITTGTTRTYTLPNANSALANLATAQTFTGVKTFSAAPVISTITNTGTLTLPTTTGTLALTSSNITGTAANVTGTVAVANGGTGVTTSTGTGSTVLSASPAFTGTPTAPTPATTDNSTTLATTAFTKTLAGTQSMVYNEVPGGTINGVNTSFTLASTPATNSLNLYKNGIRLKAGGADYTLSGSTITFVTAPASGAVLLADYNVSNTTYSVGTNSIISDEAPSGTINGANTTFTLSRAYIAGALEVYVNGIKQTRGTHFTETTPASGVFTMSDAPLTGDIVTCNYQFNLNPSSNADTVDGIHASSTATANQLLALNSSARLPEAVAPFQIGLTMAMVPPSNATTYYGGYGAIANSVSETNTRVYITQSGIITSVYLNLAAAGSPTSETFSAWIRYRNTTDTLISSSITAINGANLYTATGLTLAVVAGDWIDLKITTPAWVTAPTSMTAMASVRFN